MFCFKNANYECACNDCAFRTSKLGTSLSCDIPNIDEGKGKLTVSFGRKVIAKDFAKYFGSIQRRILLHDCDLEIVFDFANTQYINHFCISKILLTAFKVRNEKKVSFSFPKDFKNNKMLRFLYNRGILEFIFSVDEFKCYVGDQELTHFSEKHSFNECYDFSIFPYAIFEIKIEKEHNKEIEEQVQNALLKIKKYFENKNNIEKYQRIESRVRLYLFEILDNIFEHAYDDNALFAINVYNSYLPPYKVLVGTPEERKFENRITRLQKEVPMSVYKDIHDRYFGGFNIFIDDIGRGIETTYAPDNVENKYKDVYINGSKKRKTINGLKLVADQIAINSDTLWAHDGNHWISTNFSENSNICKEDKSTTMYYSHPYVMGLTYDLFVNLAQNSKEKRRTYEKLGRKISFDLEEIREIISIKDNEIFERSVFVDLLNTKNRNRSFYNELSTKSKYLFYRPRATQKNKMGSEMDTRVLEKLSDNSQFDYMIVYDLNQTTLFQIKAVFENRDYAIALIQKGIKGIILITEESWLFYMQRTGDAFFINKNNELPQDNEYQIKNIYKAIFKNDKSAVFEILEQEYSQYVFKGRIIWGYTEIEEYIDIEKMIVDRAISDLFCKSIARISGMLNENQKLFFMEKFMIMKFGALVNEYKDSAVQSIYLGSIIMSGETEKRVARDDDLKIYLFKHKECSVDLNKNHLILYELPAIKTNKKSNKQIHRRILNTNRTEECLVESEEYKYYLSTEYKKNINNVEYMLGFFNTGFFSIQSNDVLYDGYIQFVLDIIKIKLRKIDILSIQISDSLPVKKIKDKLEIGKDNILSDTEFRNLGKEITFQEKNSTSPQLIVRLGKNLKLIDLMSDINHGNCEVVYISLFNNIQFECSFSKILDAGYIPYLPIYYGNDEPLIDNAQFEKFYSFTRTLNPQYRRKLELSSNQGDFFKINTDLTTDILNFYDHLIGDFLHTCNILLDVILCNVNMTTKNLVEMDLVTGQYSVFINLLLLQHSLVKLNSVDRTKIINDILNFMETRSEEIEDSIITFYLLVVLKSISYDSSTLERLFDKDLGQKVLKSKSNQVRIMFADILNENARLKFQTELDDFYVSSDIAIYYNMLAQLSFNSHGTIHDGMLDIIKKKIVENPEDVNEEDYDNINNIIPNCISLLKLTRSYEQPINIEENLEEEFYEYASDMPNNLSKIKVYIEKLIDHAQSRFVFIDKERVDCGVKEYVNKVKAILSRKQYNIDAGDISNLIVIMDEDSGADGCGHIKRNINLYNNALIFEELAYLLHNAHKYSLTPFSLPGNADKQYLVWIRAELHGDVILLRMFNSIRKEEGKFENIIKDIRGKKRIGKTYLEKFNIHVWYDCNPKGLEVVNDDIDLFETRIEIPYFN